MSQEKKEVKTDAVSSLELQNVIGFNGMVPSGLMLHPDDEHLIYPLGSTIVVKNIEQNKQTFLQKDGHDQSVSALCISQSGKYLASGQEAYMGFPAQVIIWNLETCEIHKRLVLHKGKVESLSFSPNEKYLATLGGEDDNRVVVWDVELGEAICGAHSSNESATIVRYLNQDSDSFVTAGRYNLRIWHLDKNNRKIKPVDVNLGQLKRIILCVDIAHDDSYMYCGTSTGDLLQVSIKNHVLASTGPSKRPFSMGIHSVQRTRKGNLIVGAGDGTVAVILAKNMKVVRRLKVQGGVTSLELNAAGDHFFVGTNKCNTYLVQLQTFEHELRGTCHNYAINDVAFPANYSELFATASGPDIRVWNARTMNELLRIEVPNLECLCVTFSQDGHSILSGWSDGKIRAFKPQSGQLKYAIKDAHVGGVSAIRCTSDSHYIVSGGVGGQVRIWEIGKSRQQMVASLKEHTATVSTITINDDDTECISAGHDGACIIWNLERRVRNNAFFASTQFKAVAYHPDQSQILTTGTDRKVTYWDAVDANPIRILDGALKEVNTLCVSANGEWFISGGADKLVKLWSYDEGIQLFSGLGHSGSIAKAAISPDQQTIVTVGKEGAIFLWRVPPSSQLPQVDDVMPTADDDAKQ